MAKCRWVPVYDLVHDYIYRSYMVKTPPIFCPFIYQISLPSAIYRNWLPISFPWTTLCTAMLQDIAKPTSWFQLVRILCSASRASVERCRTVVLVVLVQCVRCRWGPVQTWRAGRVFLKPIRFHESFHEFTWFRKCFFRKSLFMKLRGTNETIRKLKRHFEQDYWKLLALAEI